MSRSTLVGAARRFWREYTRMRTAIFFLTGIVLIVLIGAFVPQAHTSDAAKVSQFLSDNPNLTSLGAAIGLPPTQVFVSVDFFILLGSLFIALGACVFRRGHALVVRSLRGYPRRAQYWGEWGSWLFHSSFFLLLIAVVLGKATGFQGRIVLVEGQRVSEARASYDDIQEGLLFNGRHENFQLQLDRFTVSYASNGAPSDFVSAVTVYDQGQPAVHKDIRVNDFLGYRNVDVYQEDYGWAPHLVVRNPAGTVVYDAPVLVYGQNRGVQTGALKVPDFGYTPSGSSRPVQLGAKVLFMPDAQEITSLAADGSVNGLTVRPGGVSPTNPIVQLQLFAGDLGLDSGQPQDVNQLDTSRMQPLANGAPLEIPIGDSVQIPVATADGKGTAFTVAVTELRQYSVFMVKKDNGVGLVYASFGMALGGLMIKLYLRPFLERRERSRRGRLVLPPVRSREEEELEAVSRDRAEERIREPVG